MDLDLVLIHPPYHRRLDSGTIFPLGLGYLCATAEKNGFKTAVLDCASRFSALDEGELERLRAWLVASLSHLNPRLLVGIGPVTSAAIRSLRVIQEACFAAVPNLPVVYGGPLPSIPDQDWLFFGELHADALIRGDGEVALSAALSTVSAGGTLADCPGVITPATAFKPTMNIVTDLEEIPFPTRATMEDVGLYVPSLRRDLFESPVESILASRGCPFRCEFCSAGVSRGGRHHRRSWKHVAQEMKLLSEGRHTKSIIFYDDSFFPSRQTVNQDVMDLAQEIVNMGIDVSWQIEVRPDIVASLTPHSITVLDRIGCRQLNMGIEREASTGRYPKGIASADVARACSKIREVAPRIRLAGTFIIGGPGETESTIIDTIRFSQELNLLFAHYNPLRVYPGTPLYQRLFGHLPSRWWYDQTINDPQQWGELIYSDGNVPKEAVLRLTSQAYAEFYGRPEWHELSRDMLGTSYGLVAGRVAKWKTARLYGDG